MYNIQSISVDDLKFHTHQIDNKSVEYFYNIMCSYKSPLPIVFYVDFNNRVLSHHAFVMALIRFINVFQPENKKVYCFKIDQKLFEKLSSQLIIEVDNKNFDSLVLDINRLISNIEDLEFMLSELDSNEEINCIKNEFKEVKMEIEKSVKKIYMAPKPKIKYNMATEIESFGISDLEELPVNNSKSPTLNTNIKVEKISNSKQNETPTSRSNPAKKSKSKKDESKSSLKQSSKSGIILDMIYKIKSKQKVSPPNNFSDILHEINNLDLLYNLCKTIKGKRRLSLPDKYNKLELINFAVQNIYYRM